MAASSLASTTKTTATIRATSRDEDLDAQGPSADLVRVYLNGIGKTALLTAEQEVDLAKRIEAGVFAGHDTAMVHWIATWVMISSVSASLNCRNSSSSSCLRWRFAAVP